MDGLDGCNIVNVSLSLTAENIINFAKIFNKLTQGTWDVEISAEFCACRFHVGLAMALHPVM